MSSLALKSLSLPREVQPEILDRLPADDPRAVRSRRDLRRINVIMAQPLIMARALWRHHASRAPRVILDLGSGDGTLMLKVARRLAPRWRGVTMLLLDQQNIVSRETIDAFIRLQWSAEPIVADVFEVLKRPPAREIDIISANLFLHHFDGLMLSRLMAQAAQRAPLFVACETLRAPLGIVCGSLTWLIGCNDVTRHDAVASVRAGFRDAELSALWPDCGCWRLHEWRAGLFTHCFAAVRTGGSDL